MSEGTLESLVAKAGEVWTAVTHKSCIAAEENNSQVQAYTAETLANAEGFAAFNKAFMSGDVDGVMAAMSDDPIFDAPNPQPDGTCFKGTTLVRLVWEMVFKAGITFEVEEMFMTGDRAVVRWNASREVDGKPQTLRGVDIFYLKGGKVAAKLTYSKADSFLGMGNPA
jgi:ketosteroid isomerase-like protein